jgi:hypothetical protein
MSTESSNTFKNITDLDNQEVPLPKEELVDDDDDDQSSMGQSPPSTPDRKKGTQSPYDPRPQAELKRNCLQAPKPKKVLNEKQKESLAKGRELGRQKLKEKWDREKQEKLKKEEEEKKQVEEKVLKKAIAIKKKQIKKELILDEISDDDTSIEEIVPLVKRHSIPAIPLAVGGRRGTLSPAPTPVRQPRKQVEYYAPPPSPAPTKPRIIFM